MDLFLIVILMFAGAGLAAIAGFTIPNASPEAIVLVTVLGGVIGAITGYSLLALAKSIAKRSRAENRIGRTPVVPTRRPKSFRKRMAHYAGKPEHDVLYDNDAYESSMPFWSAVDGLLRIPPKSAAMIRRTLMSIRRTLRG